MPSSRALLFSLLAVCAAALDVSGATLSLQTEAGDTLFYAPPGDTVVVRVDVASAGETLTGVEIFVTFDPRRFSVVDGSEDPGLQPATPTDILDDVFADTVIAASDSLSLVHFAQVDLAGTAVNGTVMTFALEVLPGEPGSSSVSLYDGTDAARSSLYTVAGPEGLSVAFDVPSAILFSDQAPILHLPSALSFPEDDTLRLDLVPLVTDEAAPADLVWSFAGPDELQTVRVGQNVEVTSPADYNGSGVIVFAVSDPAGASVSSAILVTVEPVNDAPLIDASAVPDSVDLSAAPVDLDIQALDVDDDLETLTWSAASDGPATATLTGAILHLEAPDTWTGATTVTVTVTDPNGGVDRVSLIVHAIADSVLAGDFDGSGAVDFSDFIAFAAAFGRPDADASFDLDGNGSVDFGDFVAFAAAFGG